jgi:hypothetical protein
MVDSHQPDRDHGSSNYISNRYNKLQREEWRVWNSGQPAEFDVPEKYLQVPSLYLRGNVTPIGKFATLCVMYKDRGVEHMSFDDDDSETMSQTEIDIKCR